MVLVKIVRHPKLSLLSCEPWWVRKPGSTFGDISPYGRNTRESKTRHKMGFEIVSNAGQVHFSLSF
jgi:hypothetical protein